MNKKLAVLFVVLAMALAAIACSTGGNTPPVATSGYTEQPNAALTMNAIATDVEYSARLTTRMAEIETQIAVEAFSTPVPASTVTIEIVGTVPPSAVAACGTDGLVDTVTVDGVTYKCADLVMQPQATPEPTLAPTAEPTEVVTSTNPVTATSPYSVPVFTTDLSHGAWTISGTERLDENPIVGNWIEQLLDPDPANWRTYPNIPNPDVPSFDVTAGAEYGVPNVPFCQQDMRCDFVVPGWHYRLVTARYTFLGESCEEGCLLLIVNVMDHTMTWRDQSADNGFTVAGRYWDGDRLDQAVWGLVSHTAAAMLNMPTLSHPDEVLNSGDPSNAGDNCGFVEGCDEVNVTVYVTAGDAVLAVLKTVVTRP